jgi:hypothetical protein
MIEEKVLCSHECDKILSKGSIDWLCLSVISYPAIRLLGDPGPAMDVIGYNITREIYPSALILPFSYLYLVMPL